MFIKNNTGYRGRFARNLSNRPQWVKESILHRWKRDQIEALYPRYAQSSEQVREDEMRSHGREPVINDISEEAFELALMDG